MPRAICCRCQNREVEVIDDWESSQCPECNDRDIERSNAAREWREYHPSED